MIHSYPSIYNLGHKAVQDTWWNSMLQVYCWAISDGYGWYDVVAGTCGMAGF